ncbi:hypothetical protein E4U36_006427, partial [Claviceps purpurea]
MPASERVPANESSYSQKATAWDTKTNNTIINPLQKQQLTPPMRLTLAEEVQELEELEEDQTTQAYPDNSNSPSGPTPPHHLVAPPRTGSATAVASTVITAPVPRRKHHRPEVETPEGLFPNLPEAKKRKFILVDDSVRGSRLRVRVTLDGVDTNEIPDSFRRSASVFPRSYFPREMQSPPPSPTGRRFFGNDLPDQAGDGGEETEGRGLGRRGGGSGSSGSGSQAVDLAMSMNMNMNMSIGMGMGMSGRDGSSCHPGAAALGAHRMRKSRRGREIKLNDLAGRMAWLQSRVFAGRP